MYIVCLVWMCFCLTWRFLKCSGFCLVFSFSWTLRPKLRAKDRFENAIPQKVVQGKHVRKNTAASMKHTIALEKMQRSKALLHRMSTQKKSLQNHSSPYLTKKTSKQKQGQQGHHVKVKPPSGVQKKRKQKETAKCLLGVTFEMKRPPERS